MNKTLTSKYLFPVSIFVFGLFAGMFLKDYIVVFVNDVTPPQKCFYEGTYYNSGESFPSGDSCNSCSCEDGFVSCTLMACEE